MHHLLKLKLKLYVIKNYSKIALLSLTFIRIFSCTLKMAVFMSESCTNITFWQVATGQKQRMENKQETKIRLMSKYQGPVSTCQFTGHFAKFQK